MTKEIATLVPGIIGKKLELYCAYQERCIKDVTAKLKDWNLRENQIEKIINDLKKNNFLNEARFAKSYARGKFRMNSWGKQRIAFEMHLKNIPPQLIQEGLNSIPTDEYFTTLRDLILKKKVEVMKNHSDKNGRSVSSSGLKRSIDLSSEINPEKNLNVRDKIINFVHGKGYEMNLILDMLNELKI
jgi:regulatory protein